MSNRYSNSQAAVVDQDNRNMAAAGFPMSAEINSLWATIDTGNIGITSNAGDVDSLAKGGGSFSWDQNTAPANGSLLFAWLAGRVQWPAGIVAYSAGSLTLAASSTNYIEADANGTVYANTAAFTAGRCPLYIVITGASSFTSAQVSQVKAILTGFSPNGITGAKLSTAAQTKNLIAQIGTISAATTLLIPTPNIAATVAAIRLAASVAIAQSDTAYWTITVVNLGPSGSGSTAVTGSATTNSTKLTGGSAIVAGVARSLALSTTGGATTTAAGDVLQVTLTPTGSPTNLTLAALAIDLTFTA